MRLRCYILLAPLLLGMIVVPGGVEASDKNLVTIIGAEDVKLPAKLFRTAVIKNGKQVVEPTGRVRINNSSEAVKIGKQLGVQEVFWLSLDQMDKVRFITIQKVNVSSGKVEEANGSFTHPRELQHLVSRLAEELAPKPKPEPKPVQEVKKPTFQELGYKVVLIPGEFFPADTVIEFVELGKRPIYWDVNEPVQKGDARPIFRKAPLMLLVKLSEANQGSVTARYRVRKDINW